MESLGQIVLVVILFGPVVVAIILMIVIPIWGAVHTRKMKKKYGEQLKLYNASAFHKKIEPIEGRDDIQFVTRLATEWTSDKGQLAITVSCSGFRSKAIQHINKNGTFSTKGPYFISYRSRKWKPTKRTHLVRMVSGKSGGFKTDHPNQDGTVYEYGSVILEYDTKRHAPADILEFAEMVERGQVTVR